MYNQEQKEIKLAGHKPFSFLRAFLIVGIIFTIGMGVAFILQVTLVSNSDCKTFSQTNLKSQTALDYPGACVLEPDFKKLWADINFDNLTPGAFITTDDYNKVVKYYQDKLTAQGYTISIGDICNEPKCAQTVVVEADSEKSIISLGIFSYENLAAESSRIPQDLAKQVKPGSFLILFQYSDSKQ
jgi:hypothetical protein